VPRMRLVGGRARSEGERRPRFGWLVMAIVSVVALVVAGALVLVGGDHGASASSADSVTLGRQQLLRVLGVLRAPPNAASRRAIACAKSPPKPPSAAFFRCRTSPVFLLMPPFARDPSVLAHEGYPRAETSLIRVVAIPRFKASAALIPTSWRPSPRSGQRAEGLELVVAYAGGAAGTGPTPTSVASVRAHGLAISGSNATPRMRSVWGAAVVPDGVASVTFQPIRLISPPAPVDAHRFGSVTTSVHDNIAAFRFAVPTVIDHHAKSLVYAVTLLAHATWSDQQGNVIARTTTRLPLWLRVQGNTPITATN
jgi:hypothetical protein